MNGSAEVLQFPGREPYVAETDFLMAVGSAQPVGRLCVESTVTSQLYGLDNQSDTDSIGATAVARWFNADDIPVLRQAREESETEHDRIFEQRMATVREGSSVSVPIEVDPLTAGDMANEARRLYGEDSDEYRQKRTSLDINSQRFLGETASKNGPEYFDFLWQPFDMAADDYVSYGTASSDITRNGITPLAEEYEQPRRKYDHGETGVNRVLGKSLGRVALHGALASEAAFLPVELRRAKVVSSTTISELPTVIKQRWIEDDAKGIQRPYGGYAPQDDKFMIRRTRFVNGTQGRDFEQLALPGKLIKHQDIQKLWVMQGTLSQEQAADVSQDNSQSIRAVATGDIGVLDTARMLDTIAGKRLGIHIFLGEEVAADHPKDYAGFPAAAAARQDKLKQAAKQLSDYVEALSAQGVDHFLANGLYEKYAKKLMFALAKDDVELAGRTFDQVTVHKIRDAQIEAALGNHQLAEQMMAETEASAPPLEGCGAGSCELEAVRQDSAANAMAEKAGLTGEKLRFKKSSCANCPKEGTVLFDAKGNMFCESCHASKVDGVIKGVKTSSKANAKSPVSRTKKSKTAQKSSSII